MSLFWINYSREIWTSLSVRSLVIYIYIVHYFVIEYDVGAFCIAKDAKFLYADNEGSVQTARMRTLIYVFVGRTCQKIRFLTLGPLR